MNNRHAGTRSLLAALAITVCILAPGQAQNQRADPLSAS